MSKTILLCIKVMVLVMMFSSVSSDFAQDRKECGGQLSRLSTCLPFVGGEAKTPASTCCANLRQEINSTKKCLCLLIKDRNDPQLGFKINATNALSLPSICHSSANVSECPKILHLAPNSTEAQVFQQFAASGNSSAIAADTPTSLSFPSRRKKWLEVMVSVIITALAITI